MLACIRNYVPQHAPCIWKCCLEGWIPFSYSHHPDRQAQTPRCWYPVQPQLSTWWLVCSYGRRKITEISEERERGIYSLMPRYWCQVWGHVFFSCCNWSVNPHNTVWGQYDRVISMRWTKTISITVLRFYDFVRLYIVISFQIIFSNSTHEWHLCNQICVVVRSDPVNNCNAAVHLTKNLNVSSITN